MTDKYSSKSIAVKRRHNIKWWDVIKYILLFIGAFAVAFPVIWMLFNSFKTNSEIIRIPPTFFPTKPIVSNFIEAWNRVSFATYLRNTAILALSISAIICYTSAMLGYTLAKLKFWGRSGVFLTILISMMFPWSLTIIPLYKMMFVFKVQGTWLPLYFTTFFSAFGIFLMRQFCLSIPDDLIDAARIDGANEFRLFHRIILPMLGPPISALAIFVFLGTWDDFLWPFLNINTDSLSTINIGLQRFLRVWEQSIFGPLLAGTSISIVPILIFYFIFQRRFVEGASLSGLKE